MSAQTGKVTKIGTKSALAVQRPLLADVRELIVQARAGVARAVDSGLTTLYWHVGQRIRQDILKGGFKFQVQRVVDDAVAYRLPVA